ncbi:MAG: amidohydrolase [Candidatus Tectomicrobia bacterium]|nr:amidohydrolase [Candidatus Tectomicrobia bacterium]
MLLAVGALLLLGLPRQGAAQPSFRDMLLRSLGAYELGDYRTALESLSQASQELHGKLKAAEGSSAATAGARPYPIINAHEHVRAGMDVARYIKLMDEFNIAKVVFLPTGEAPNNQGYELHLEALLQASRSHPGRIIPFTTVDHHNPGALASLQESVARGAVGLKLMAGHPYFYREPLDSPPLRDIYRFSSDRNLPVIIHAELKWSARLYREFQEVLRLFPNLRLILAHLGNLYHYPGGLRELAGMLDRHPNLAVDVSMGQGFPYYARSIHWNPTEVRQFFTTYQERIVWGSDQVIAQTTPTDHLRKVLSIELALLERRAYTASMDGFPAEPVKGLHLPETVLRKILYDNPTRLFNLQ